MIRSDLRGELRARRRALGAAERARLSRRICREVLKAIGPAPRGRHVAAYVALPEEPDLAEALTALARRGVQLYLPRITSFRRRRLAFVSAGGERRVNRFGIAEPPPGARARPATRLDIVLLPLVGFDAKGARLGMGGGYYDRALAFRRHRRAGPRPRLIGIAFACQQVDALPVAAHDVRLDAVITEHGLTRVPRSPR